MLTLLLENPLAELADLRDEQEFGLETVGFRPIPPEVRTRNDSLRAAESPVTARITGTVSAFVAPGCVLDDSRIASLVHSVFVVAAQADRKLDAPMLCEPMSRAITAGVCAEVLSADGLRAEFQWNEAAAEIGKSLNDQLGVQRGIFTAVGSRALTAALSHGLRNRVMPALSLFTGDVLSWFRNREEILRRVHQTVEAADSSGPLVLLGHSLGGVIAFEYCSLAIAGRRRVDLLATVGSQVGWFAETGVLQAPSRSSLGKHPMPPEVRSWHNLYDPDDALSFLAAPLFDGVNDIELDTHAPFPISHSEYWNMPETYRKLTAAVMTL